MQENEKYGIELEAKTSLFKKGIQEAIKYTKAFGQGVKESFNEQVTKAMKDLGDFFREDFNIFDKDYSKRIEYIRDEMDAVMDQINAIKEGGGEGNLEELEAEYDRLTKKLEFFTSKQSELNDELEETDSQAQKTKSTLSTLFDASVGKIKRFTYYLLGARSVFSLFMKYRSAYYQFNEEMQYQSELSTNAIALSLGPAFEFLGNIITYASIGLAKFIELLTGVNVLSKVTTKGIRDYNKSLKETQTLVSGIDEITNLTNPQNLGLASQYQALAEFQKKVAEVEKFFAENEWIGDLAKGLKTLWGYLQEGYDYIKAHWDVFKYIFGAVAIGIVVSTAGPLGKLALIAGATMALVGWVQKLKKSNDEASKSTDKLRDSEQKLKNLRDTTKDAEDEYIQAIDEKTEAMNRLTEAQDNTGQSGEELYKKIQNHELNYEQLSDDLKVLYKAYRDYINATEDAEKKERKFKDATIQENTALLEQKGLIMEIDNAYDETFSNLVQRYRNHEIDAKTFVATITTYMEGMSEDFRKTFVENLPDDVKLAFGEASKQISDTGDTIHVFKDGAELSFQSVASSAKTNMGNAKKEVKNLKDEVIDATRKIKELADAYKAGGGGYSVGGGGTGAGGGGGSFGGRGYANGLDYVPYDNYPALLHKGEAVVPAKYNPTIHSQGSDYTNSLLETLIIKMDDLASRPNVFEVDGQQFAQATYNLYDSERKRQGYVEGVVR